VVSGKLHVMRKARDYYFISRVMNISRRLLFLNYIELVALFHTKAKMLAGGAFFVGFQQQTRKTQASSDFITCLNFIYATTSISVSTFYTNEKSMQDFCCLYRFVYFLIDDKVYALMDHPVFLQTVIHPCTALFPRSCCFIA
jgi:hypothetical protein